MNMIHVPGLMVEVNTKSLPKSFTSSSLAGSGSRSLTDDRAYQSLVFRHHQHFSFSLRAGSSKCRNPAEE